MLLETISRNDKQGQVKLVCVEVLRSKGQHIPVSSVPTLITLPERHVLTGKSVFDYLLLPGKGKLLIPVNKQAESASTSASAPASRAPEQNNQDIGGADPMAFSINGIGKGLGDKFTDINHEGSTIDIGNPDRAYQWTLIADQEKTPMSIGNFSPEDTRPKKPQIDLETFKMQRDLDLQQSDLNTTMLVPPSFTR